MSQKVSFAGNSEKNDDFGPFLGHFSPLDDEFPKNTVVRHKYSTELPDAIARMSVGNEMRYIEPPLVPEMPERCITYDNARELVDAIQITPGSVHYGYVSGSFIFGDFIEALMVQNNFHTERMLLATLSLSEENVDSLANLLDGGFVDNLDLLISHFQYAHKQHTLVPYIYKQLDKDNRFQLAVAREHLKLCVFKTDCGKHIGIRGSANLSSADCIEFLFIHDNKALYDYDLEKCGFIFDHFFTINKPVGGESTMAKSNGSATGNGKGKGGAKNQKGSGSGNKAKKRSPKLKIFKPSPGFDIPTPF
ncbi:hypothetical protein [Tellurirhabdus bombi]|uniref:hypothetical protein n=1 Tax=Tellurirhabdus bombi TaxID=2907205 RepID=UPI001F1F35D0|nr:hypothetical protein [Tellurirhabdus bombi]